MRPPSDKPTIEPAFVPNTLPPDAFLIDSMRTGDAAALSKLMERYDRLVRFTIFRASKSRCVADPQWLDSIASSTWFGFVRSMRRSAAKPPASVASYLMQIARNQTAEALEAAAQSRVGIDAPIGAINPDEVPPQVESDVDTVLAEMEDLHVLRDCMEQLDPDDRELMAQLSAITQRRWQNAAQALGLQESTLRSRWKKVLERLRAMMNTR